MNLDLLKYPVQKKKYYLIPLYILLFVVSFGLVSADAVQESLDESINSYYKLDGNSFSDATGNFSDAFNAGTTNTSGKINDGRSFDGSTDYIKFGDTFDETETAYAISVWFKTSATGKIMNMLSSRNDSHGTNNLWNLEQRDSDDKIIFVMFDGGSFVQTMSTSTYNDGAWHHVVGTVDTVANNMSLYIDGARVHSAAYGLTYVGYDDNIGVYLGAEGTAGGGPTRYWDGDLDEPIIWRTALNETQVTRLYNAQNTNGTQYPFSGVVVTELQIDDISLINNTYYDSENLTVGVNITPILTNSNINTSFFLNNTLIGGEVAYYRFEDNSNDVLDNYDGTDTGMSYTNGLFGRGAEFDGTAYINIGNINTTYAAASWGGWVHPDTVRADRGAMINNMNGAGTEGFRMAVETNDKARCWASADTNVNLYSANALNLEDWNHVMCVYNGVNVTMYVDGVYSNSVALTGTLKDWNSNIFLGARTTTDDELEGIMDEFKIFQTGLTPTDILYLFNGSYTQIGTNTQNASGTITNIAEGSYNNSGVVVWNNETSTYNTGYNINFDFNPPALVVAIPTEINTYTINLTNFINVSDTGSGIASCTVDFSSGQSSDCVNASFTFSVNGNISYNVTALDMANNTNISTGIVLVNPTQYIYFVDTSSSPLTNFSIDGTDYGDFYSFEVFDFGYGTHQVQFTKLGYIDQTINFTLNTTSELNLTFTVSDARILLYIRDQVTGDIINGTNFTVNFIATVGLETSTVTGLVNVTNVLFQSEQYLVVISNAAYQTENIYFDFTNQEQIILNAYMINASEPNLGTVIIKPVDSFAQPITGAIVKALQWDSVSSTYVEVSQAQTGSDGQGTLNIILNDKVYIFTASFNGVTVNSTQEIIDTAEDGKIITLVLTGVITEFDYILENVQTLVTQSFNDSTNISTISFFWHDLQGISQTVCINSYRLIGATETQLTENCTTGSSGIYILSFFVNSSYTTLLKGEIKVYDKLYTIKSFTHLPNQHPSNLLENLGLDIFVVPFLFLAAMGIALLIENVFVGTALVMVFGGLSLLLAPTILTKSIVAFLFFVGWLTINYGVKSR